MSDVFIEQLVKKSRTKEDKSKAFAILLIAVIVSVFTFMFFLPAFVPVLLVSFTAAIAVVYRTKDIEYEYFFTNTEFEIDAIYNRSRRSKKVCIDLKDSKIITYYNNPKAKEEYGNLNELNYSSCTNEENTYYCVNNIKGADVKVVFEPNEKLINAIEQKIGKRTFIKKPI